MTSILPDMAGAQSLVRRMHAQYGVQDDEERVKRSLCPHMIETRPTLPCPQRGREPPVSDSFHCCELTQDSDTPLDAGTASCCR